jgi:acetate kinase
MPSILVINSGSSSLKFSLIDINSQSLLLSGIAEKIGLSDSFLIIKKGDTKETIQLESSTHQAAMEYIFTFIQRAGLNDAIVAIGHRVVHGGEFFKSAVLIDDAVIKTIEDCIAFAPLHNPAHLEGIRAARLFAPTLPQVAVFDTSFHQTLAEHAYLYALPMEYYHKYGVRRYGFHGTSHRYVSQQAALLQHKDLSDSAYITAHLGNGASITAVLNGKSVDTSMGFTPLEGLVMGTRTGDIDPAIIPYLAGVLNISAYDVVNTFNKMTTSLPRVDALIFTGGIGENSPIVRSKTLKRIQVLGYNINEELNDKAVRGTHGIITTPDSIPSLVINTNEELMIALDTAACITINSTY